MYMCIVHVHVHVYSTCTCVCVVHIRLAFISWSFSTCALFRNTHFQGYLIVVEGVDCCTASKQQSMASSALHGTCVIVLVVILQVHSSPQCPECLLYHHQSLQMNSHLHTHYIGRRGAFEYMCMCGFVIC